MADREDFATAIGALIKNVPEATELGTADLDTITKPGPYSQNFSANATLARHYPADALRAGRLTVVANASRSMVTQWYITMDRTDAVRYLVRNYFGTWGDWRHIDLTTRPTGTVVDARPWLITPHSWLSATTLVVNGPSVTMTISARADTATPIPAGTIIGSVPAAYRPLNDVYALGQNIGNEGMWFKPNGDISCPAVNAGSYFKASASWTR